MTCYNRLKEHLTMKCKPKSTSWNKTKADTVALFVTEDNWQKELKQADTYMSEMFESYLSEQGFKAKEGQIVSLPTMGKIAAHTLLIIGVGKRTEVSLHIIQKVSANLSKTLKSSANKLVALDLTSSLFVHLNTHELAKSITEALILGSYLYTKYRSEAKKDPKTIEELWLLVTPSKLQHTSNGIREGELHAAATTFARDLINESPTVTTPAYMADIANSLGKRGEVKVEILEEAQVKKMGMNSFLAVTRGSDEPAKFIKLTYKGGGKKKVVLAGKAITFDTGGLSIKDAKNMETMKLDMAGAAAVLGVFSVLTKLKPKAEVVGLIAACENMPGPRAMKPGDIVTAMNGKTIEILNTDAEGRLTLADVLSYAVKEKPDYIIDLATLTGACMVALGEDIAGLFSNNAELTKKLLNAAHRTGEKIWELPLEKEYRDSVKSHIADLRNIASTRYGGAITAALFLEEFVDRTPWAHLDIAGPAFAEKEMPLVPRGGAGFGVRMLLEFLANF